MSPDTILWYFEPGDILDFLEVRFLEEALLFVVFVPKRLFPSAAHEDMYCPLLLNGYSDLGRLCEGVEFVPLGS